LVQACTSNVSSFGGCIGTDPVRRKAYSRYRGIRD
jgi:hypothetical protein